MAWLFPTVSLLMGLAWGATDLLGRDMHFVGFLACICCTFVLAPIGVGIPIVLNTVMLCTHEFDAHTQILTLAYTHTHTHTHKHTQTHTQQKLGESDFVNLDMSMGTIMIMLIIAVSLPPSPPPLLCPPSLLACASPDPFSNSLIPT
jgi:hypothetical protein